MISHLYKMIRASLEISMFYKNNELLCTRGYLDPLVNTLNSKSDSVYPITGILYKNTSSI
jgi:hypothetical protein